MEPVSLGWECLIQSWINQLSSYITSHYKQMLKSLILRFAHPILYFLRRYNVTVILIRKIFLFTCFYYMIIIFQEIFPSANSNLIRSLTNICETFMDVYNNQEHMKTISQSDLRAQLEVIIKLYYYYK